MKRSKTPLIKNTIGGCLLLGAMVSCTHKKVEKKPNVLVILTDDQQCNTLHALGNNEIITPNIDRLANNACVFTNAYCFGGNTAAVCVPSRNMLMSGRTFFQFEDDCREILKTGQKPRRKAFTNPEWLNLPKLMNKAGYETYYREKSGKANNPVVRTHFDHFEDVNQVEALRSGRPAKSIVDDAIRFLTKERNLEKPFFMYLGVPAPHDPRWSLKKFRDMYELDSISIPENYQPKHLWDIGSMTCRDECLEKWPRTRQAIKRHILDYYATITAMDFDIGRLINELERRELMENTIVIFTSDQGIALGQHGLMGKQNIYEGTMKVPFLIKGPRIKAQTSNAFIYLHDVLPTLCDFAQIEKPEGLDGRSFHEIAMGKKDQILYNVVLAYKESQRSVRVGDWKLIRFPKIDKTLLFNLENDPNETQNLALLPAYEVKVKTLLGKLEQERKLLGDKIDLFPKEYENSEFVAPKEKLPTPYPAGGLAPGDPSYNN